MKKLYFTKQITIDNKISSFYILDLFQDIAGDHAEYLKIDSKNLIKRNLMWVVVRNRFELIKTPSLNEKVILATWPHKTNRIEFDREYCITSLDGDVYIKGDSKWCLLDINTKKIALVKDILNDGDFYDKYNFNTPLKPIPNKEFSSFNYIYEKIVSEDQIDVNNHLNNAEYAKMIDECIKFINKPIKLVEINYIKETKYQQKLSFKLINEENVYYLEGYVDNVVHVRAKVVI